MAYNHGREDRKWRIWKEAEEKSFLQILIWILYSVKISHEKPTTKNAFDFTLTVKCIL